MFPGTGTGSDGGNHCSVCLPRVGSAGGRLLSGGHGYIVLVRSGLYDPPALGGGWWGGGWWGGGHRHFVLVSSGFLVISVICSSYGSRSDFLREKVGLSYCVKCMHYSLWQRVDCVKKENDYHFF